MNSPREQRFAGRVASTGVVAGTIVRPRRETKTEGNGRDPAEARAALDHAIAEAGAQLRRLADKADPTAAAILEFQLALLADPALTDPTFAAIAAGLPADRAWRQALDAQIEDYMAAGDDYFSARAGDLHDLRDRVLDSLAGGGATIAAVAGGILVDDDLTPSRFLEIDWTAMRGAALFAGSTASHVAILARARGVPLLTGLGAAAAAAPAGADAILDADSGNGRLILDPAPATRQSYARRLAELRAHQSHAATYLDRSAVTADGVLVKIYLNVDSPALLAGVDPRHCDGIGLTRTEFLFHGGGCLPKEEIQFAAYSRLIDWAAGRPVTIRTLDAGGDKPIAGLTPDGESNPFLGVRGLRLSLKRPEVFAVQLRALARAAALGPLKVMLPMVTVPAELEETRRLFEAAVAAAGAAGHAARMPALGIMVEVPAAALRIAGFDADFLSIGSNDLIQYTLAVGRDARGLEALQNPEDPAVLDLIRRVAEEGRARGIEVSVCGDMAAQPAHVAALLSVGIRALSVPPAALASVKAAVAQFRTGAEADPDA